MSQAAAASPEPPLLAQSPSHALPSHSQPSLTIAVHDPAAEMIALNDQLRSLAIERDSITEQLEKSKESALFSHNAASAVDAQSNELSLRALREKHGQILTTISSIQHRTGRILADQERDLIRAFRARLSDVSAELDRERAKNTSGSAEYIARCRKLGDELDYLKDLTEKLNNENKSLTKENKKLKKSIKIQQDDREFLIRQLVAAKKENQLLRGRVEGKSASEEKTAIE